MGLFGGGGSSPLPGSLGAAGGLPLPSFDSGTPYVPRDMIAKIHRGERIVPAAENAAGRLGVRGGGGHNITVNVAGGNGPPSLIRANAGRGAREVLSILSRARRYG